MTSSGKGRFAMSGQQVSVLPILLAVLSGVVTLGSIGPWATFGILEVAGTHGDGKLTLVLAVVALTLSLLRLVRSSAWLYGLAGLCLAAAGLIGLYDWVNLERELASPELEDNIFADALSVAWGLQAVTLAGIIGAVLALGTVVSSASSPPQDGDDGDDVRPPRARVRREYTGRFPTTSGDAQAQASRETPDMHRTVSASIWAVLLIAAAASLVVAFIFVPHTRTEGNSYSMYYVISSSNSLAQKDFDFIANEWLFLCNVLFLIPTGGIAAIILPLISLRTRSLPTFTMLMRITSMISFSIVPLQIVGLSANVFAFQEWSLWWSRHGVLSTPFTGLSHNPVFPISSLCSLAMVAGSVGLILTRGRDLRLAKGLVE